MSSTARLIQRLGLAIAVCGLIGGAVAYVDAGADEESDAVAEQREMRQVDRLGGTAAVQTVKFDHWLASLWHGERLGFTLAVLGLLVGGACWKLGELAGEETLDEG